MCWLMERNLEPDQEGSPVRHSDINDYFQYLGADGYILRSKGH